MLEGQKHGGKTKNKMAMRGWKWLKNVQKLLKKLVFDMAKNVDTEEMAETYAENMAGNSKLFK